MDKKWDILGVGSATVDEFLVVDRFPTADSKQELAAVDRQGGGLIATAVVAAARLGVRCAYADVLGEDDLSQWIEADLQREGVDVSLVVRHPAVQPIRAFIIVAEQTRTILFTKAGRQDYAKDYPPLEAVQAARVLLLDDVNQANIPHLLRAARTARVTGIPVVADFEAAPQAELLHEVDHLVVSAHYAEQVTGRIDPTEALQKLWHDQRSAVVITYGADGSWFITSEGKPTHQPAFAVAAVDTTGCGDVFHGAYAAALIWGWNIDQRVRFASACAALNATQLGGRKGIPTLAQAEAFLASSADAAVHGIPLAKDPPSTASA